MHAGIEYNFVVSVSTEVWIVSIFLVRFDYGPK
jgi:hypothetical protein